LTLIAFISDNYKEWLITLIAKLIEADQHYQDFYLFFLHKCLDLDLFFYIKVRRENKENYH